MILAGELKFKINFGEADLPHICHWHCNYLLDNRLRRLLHPPEKLLSGYLRPGQTALDAGCGMGLFSLPMAGLVGDTGKVIAVDLQPEGLKVLRRRAAKAGLDGRIRTVAGDLGELPLQEKIDFALAFYCVHEVPDFSRFFRRIAGLLNPGGRLLVCEPKGHVKAVEFEQTLAAAHQFGLILIERPAVRWSHAALLGIE